MRCGWSLAQPRSVSETRSKPHSFLVEARGEAKGLRVMAVLLLVLFVIVFLEERQMLGFPIGTIFRHGRLELADLFGNSFYFEFESRIDVDPIIGFVGRGVEEI